MSKKEGKTHEGDVCFHQGALLFYNGQKCISCVVLLTVKSLFQLNRKDTLEQPARQVPWIQQWVFLPLTPALLAAYQSATAGQRGAATTEQLSYA